VFLVRDASYVSDCKVKMYVSRGNVHISYELVCCVLVCMCVRVELSVYARVCDASF